MSKKKKDVTCKVSISKKEMRKLSKLVAKEVVKSIQDLIFDLVMGYEVEDEDFDNCEFPEGSDILSKEEINNLMTALSDGGFEFYEELGFENNVNRAISYIIAHYPSKIKPKVLPYDIADPGYALIGNEYEEGEFICIKKDMLEELAEMLEFSSSRALLQELDNQYLLHHQKNKKIVIIHGERYYAIRYDWS